jgi:hypothetical protein
MPPSATGSDATLKDMIIWPSAIAIIGTQDWLSSAGRGIDEIVVVVMTGSPFGFEK